MKRLPLTAKQMQIAVYMLAYLRANDNMPTMAQASRDFGMQPNGIYEHKKTLVKKGLLEPTESINGTYRFARTTQGQALLSQVMAHSASQQVDEATAHKLLAAIDAPDRFIKHQACPATASTKQVERWLEAPKTN
jgi:DNA-binding IclR family transcriptional regulator